MEATVRTEETAAPTLPWKEVGLALGGAALVGVATGFRGGVADVLLLGAGMPLAVLALGLLVVPSLCIGLAVAGVQGSTGSIVKTCADAAGGAGRVLLGLAPALLVLAATGTVESSRAYAAVGLAAAVVTGLAAARTLAKPGTPALPVFVAWAVVTAGIGTLLVTRVLFGA